MKDGIKKRAKDSPVYTSIIIALCAVALFSLPNVFHIEDRAWLFALHLIVRCAAVALSLITIKILGFKAFKFSFLSPFEVLLLTLGFIVCVNNFPIIGILTGNVRFYSEADFIRYVLYCLVIGASEEAVFRGLIFPILRNKFCNKRCGMFWTVAVSATIFSLCHAFNVFSVGIGATALQVGYTFLTGGLFGLAFVITENLIAPTILHIVFDIGGLMFSVPFEIAYGNMWDVYTVIITAVLGVLTTAAGVIYLLKKDDFTDKKECL